MAFVQVSLWPGPLRWLSYWLLCLIFHLADSSFPKHQSHFHKSLCSETPMAPTCLWHKGQTSWCVIQTFLPTGLNLLFHVSHLLPPSAVALVPQAHWAAWCFLSPPLHVCASLHVVLVTSFWIPFSLLLPLEILCILSNLPEMLPLPQNLSQFALPASA